MSDEALIEYVVLVDDDGRPTGSAPKGNVHGEDTPLHLAFSCWLIDEHGRTLLTRRAATKLTWPSTWTNSFCGHPGPEESPADAVVRRARHELGVDVQQLQLVLPDFRYRAVMANGITENEICPVYVARATGDVVANPDEVAELTWVSWLELQRRVETEPNSFSPWLVLQLRELRPELFG